MGYFIPTVAQPYCPPQPDPVLFVLGRIDAKLEALLAQGVATMADLSAIDAAVARAEAAVAADTALDSSAVTLLDQLAQLVRDNAADPAALQALADRLDSANTSGDSSNADLVAALTRNTQADPNVPPAEPPA